MLPNQNSVRQNDPSIHSAQPLPLAYKQTKNNMWSLIRDIVTANSKVLIIDVADTLSKSTAAIHAVRDKMMGGRLVVETSDRISEGKRVST